MNVRDVMSTNFLTIDELTTVENAIKIMGDNSLSFLIIEPLDKKDSYGIVTEIDILYKVIAKGRDSEKLYVRDIMMKPCIEVKPDLKIQSVAQLFAKTGISSAPIVQKKLFGPKKLLGVISVRDLISQGKVAKNNEQVNDEIKKATANLKPKKSSQAPEEHLTDYQRLRAQGAISAYSTRIFDKMPQQEEPELSSDDLIEQPEQIKPEQEKENKTRKTASRSKPNKSSQAPEEHLTDYQRLRAQGAISAYSTRIFDKMPKDQTDDDES
ncbi:MAG: CBS domain-containing protein [Cyanobacteria bacterium P01_F01_bin.143]